MKSSRTVSLCCSFTTDPHVTGPALFLFGAADTAIKKMHNEHKEANKNMSFISVGSISTKKFRDLNFYAFVLSFEPKHEISAMFAKEVLLPLEQPV